MTSFARLIAKPALRFAALAGVLATVAACADSTQAPPAASASSMHAPSSSPGQLQGHWQVSGVHPSAVTPLPTTEQTALVGRVLTLSPGMAQDVEGRVCSAPSYVSTAQFQSQAFGYRQPMSGEDVVVTNVTVMCQGAQFARFLLLPSGVVLAEHLGTWVSLSPSANGHPHMPMHAAAPMGTAPMGEIHRGHMMDGAMAHLASYRSEGMAREGWGKLKAKYGELASFQPHLEKVSLGKQGTFIRLMATGGSTTQLQNLCDSLNKRKAYCMMMLGGKMVGQHGPRGH